MNCDLEDAINDDMLYEELVQNILSIAITSISKCEKKS